MHPVRMMAVGLLATALLLVAGIPLASAAEEVAEAPPIATARQNSGPLPTETGGPISDELQDCTPVIGVSPEPIDFGEIEIGQVGSIDVSIDDLEGETGCFITVTNIALAVNPGAVFALLNLPSFPVEVEVGTPLVFQVTFAPSEAGVRQGELQITSDDEMTPVKSVLVQGQGSVGTPDTITITAPNGGEEFAPNQMTQITWTSEGAITNVDVDLSIDSGGSWVNLGPGVPNNGSFDWLVQNTPTENALIRVQDTDANPSDISDAVFTINGVEVTSPNGGESWEIGSSQQITWSEFGTIANVRIELSEDDGTNWTDIEATVPNTGTFDWTVAGNPTTDARVRISDAGNAEANDISDNVFTLIEPGGDPPPTCDNGGPYTGTVDVPVNFDGSNSTDNSAIVSYEWDFGDGNSGTGPTPTHTYTVAALYTVTLTVTDDATPDPGVSTCETTADISGGNQAPTCATGGPYTGTVDQPVSFDGSASTDPDGTIESYVWDFGDGNTGTGATPTHTYTSAGLFTVTLDVTDNLGASSNCETTADITGGGGPVPPNCDAGGPYSGETGQAINFDGSNSSDPDGTIVSYEWDFGDGNTGTGATPTHTYSSANTYTVELTVTDDDTPANSTTCSTTAEIADEPPQPPICDAGGPYAGSEGVPIIFNGTGSTDPDGVIVSYEWDFGDGATGTGSNPTHTYSSAGSYTVGLTVTDDDNSSTSCNTTAEIVVPPTGVEVAVPPISFGSENDDAQIPVFVLDDLTGLGILSTEFSLTYNPQVIQANDVSLAGTIGEGGTMQWEVEEISHSEEIIRVAISWVTPIEDCEELAWITFHATNRPDDRSPVDLELIFNEGEPEVTAHDGEFIKHILGDANCSGNISPLDASLVLQISVGSVRIPDQRYPCLSVPVADVSGNGTVTALDASYIQRFALGMIEHFPAEDVLECERPFTGGEGQGISSFGGPIAALPRALGLTSSAAGADGSFEVTISADDLAGVLGGDLALRYDVSSLRVVEVTPLLSTERALLASRVGDGIVHLGVALSEAEPGPADLARVRFAHQDVESATASPIDFARAELNEGEIASATSGTTAPLPSAASAQDSLEVVVPLRAYGSRRGDVEVPVFVRDDVTGLDVFSTDIVIGYDPDVLTGMEVDLGGTIGDGGITEVNVVRINEDLEEIRVSIAWVTALEGCGTFANVLFQATQRSSGGGPPMSPLDLEVVFNEGEPPVKTESGTFIRSLLGDVNGSGNLSPLDATLILQFLSGQFEIPNSRYPNFVLEVADTSGNGEIRALDASFILQKILGIIEDMPGENIGLECNEGGGLGRSVPVSPVKARELRLDWVSVEEREAVATLRLDEGSGILGLEASLGFDPSVLRAVEVLAVSGGEGSLMESRIEEGRVQVASAWAEASAGGRELVRIRFERRSPGDGELEIEVVNEGVVPVVGRASPLSSSPVVGGAILWQNRPNPFNPSTEIGFVTGQAGRVELAVFDLGGRRVRTLVRDYLPAGEHRAEWNGRDEAGGPVAAGVYLYTLDAAGERTTRKMLLIK